MKLNTENINQLADHIEQCKEVTREDHRHSMGPSFTMRNTIYSCGAPACMLGHNQALHKRSVRCTPMDTFANDLGITVTQAEELTCPADNNSADYRAPPGYWSYISKARAVAVLRHLADTGKVDWTIN